MNKAGFGLIERGVFIQKTCNNSSGLVEKKVICGRVSRAAPVVLEIIARPYARVSFVECKLSIFGTGSWVFVAASEQALLPLDMTIERRPHLTRKFEIASPAQMPQQPVEEHQVHVVVV